MAKEDPAIRAWDTGGHGESRLGAFIEREVGDAVIALHDRVIPGLNGQNIDHLFVAPSGVWIVDAKTYKGKMERRDAGPLWRADFQIYVGGRNRTKLVDGMTNQIRAVRIALEQDPAVEHIEFHPALCFIDTEWGLLQRPFDVRGVIVMSPGALRSRLKKDGPLSRSAMERIAETLALSLPAARGKSARQ
jgi:hypothetical protein